MTLGVGVRFFVCLVTNLRFFLCVKWFNYSVRLFFSSRCGFYFHLVSGCCVSTDRLTLPPCVGGWVGG